MGADGRVDGQLSVGEGVNIICLDFETHFTDQYSLSKMSTEAYVRDTRFEPLGVAVSSNGEPAYWVPKPFVSGHLSQFDWSKLACLCHHAHFDGLILSHHYGIKPAYWFCSLSMARLCLGNHLSVGLDSLAKHFGLAAKTVPYTLFKNKKWEELDPVVQQQVGDGACHDVNLTFSIFSKLLQGTY